MDALEQDLRFAARGLARSRGFAAATLATLALGIGATTAIFSVVSRLMLSPLPFPEPERLAHLYGTSRLVPERDHAFNLVEVRRQSASLEALAGYEVGARYWRGAGEPERVPSVKVERDFFAVLGVAPLLGRTLRPDDPLGVVVVGETFWRTKLGGDARAVGRPITLDGEPFTVVGVMPESFQFPSGSSTMLAGVATAGRTGLWTPIGTPERPINRIARVVARLKPGIAMAAAERELALIASRLEAADPKRNAGRGFMLVPLGEDVVAPSVRRPLWMLFGAVGLVLALACANVANLTLTRVTLRGREIAIRSALGASPGRLARIILAESLLLSLGGGVLGLALAWGGTRWLLSIAAAHVPRAHEIGFDARVWAMMLVACAVTAALSGLAPALIARRADGRALLQESTGQSTMGGARRRLRDSLVVAEVALAFVLAVGAALLVRELARLRETDAGMATANVLTVHLGQKRAPDSERRLHEIADRVAALPGVRAAGFTQMLPLQNWGWTSNSSDFVAKGRAPHPVQFPIELRFVTPGYFDALGVRVVAGRGFTVRDDSAAPRVLVINETLARRYFGAESPIGVEVNRGTIVGVIADVRQAHLDRPAEPEIYTAVRQNWSQVSELGMTLVVRTAGRPEAVAGPVRAIVREVDPGAAIFQVKSMERVVAESLSAFTLFLLLMAGFAALALVLATTGTYGVIAYVAASRAREMAIRVALGADGRRIARLVVGQGLRLAAVGLALGLLGALAVSPLLRLLPVTVRPPDGTTMGPVALVVALLAVAACLVPARRAARADPMGALRSE